MKKLIIFADGLDVDSGLTQFDTNSGDTPKPFKLMGSNMIGVHRAFRSVTNPTFGWGTTFTNDFMGCVPGRSDLMRPISLVCKVKSANGRSEEHTSELQSLMRRSYAIFCLKKKTINK